MPSIEYDKRKIEGHKLKIQGILDALNRPSPPLIGNGKVGESAPQSPSNDLCDTASAFASESGRDYLLFSDIA